MEHTYLKADPGKTHSVELTHTHTSGDRKPDLETLKKNKTDLLSDLAWLEQIIRERTVFLQEQKDDARTVPDIKTPPALTGSVYAGLVHELALNYAGRLMLITAFARQFKPGLFAPLQDVNQVTGDRYYETGGYSARPTGRFIPTLKTVLFLLTGGNDLLKTYYEEVTAGEHPLFTGGIIRVNERDIHGGDSRIDSEINLDEFYYSSIQRNKEVQLDYSETFPAALLTTDKTFDDLILSDEIKSDLETPMNYVRNQTELFAGEDEKRKLGKGYVLMLYGPSGTGKTLTASVIGKELGVDVYRVHLPRVISKYIGETEKNLEQVFTRLEGKNCILFFDEADALFGKRIEVKDAKDRYANQEVSYLLQRIEKWNGLIILATNLEHNLDTAFERRILTKILYKPPGQSERLTLWQTHLPARFTMEPAGLAEKLAASYPVNGGTIAKVMKLACVKAVAKGTFTITGDMVTGHLAQECMQNNVAFGPNNIYRR